MAELNAPTSDPEIAARAVIKPEFMDEFSLLRRQSRAHHRRRVIRRSGRFGRSGNCDFRAQVDILDGVEKLNAFLHGTLERFAPGYEGVGAGTLVDHGAGTRFIRVLC